MPVQSEVCIQLLTPLALNYNQPFESVDSTNHRWKSVVLLCDSENIVGNGGEKTVFNMSP